MTATMKISDSQLDVLALVFWNRPTSHVKSQTLRSLYRAGLVQSVLEGDMWVRRLTDKGSAAITLEGDVIIRTSEA